MIRCSPTRCSPARTSSVEHQDRIRRRTGRRLGDGGVRIMFDEGPAHPHDRRERKDRPDLADQGSHVEAACRTTIERPNTQPPSGNGIDTADQRSERGEQFALPPHPLIQYLARRGADPHEPQSYTRRRRARLIVPLPHHFAGATDRRLPIRQDEFHGKLIARFEPLRRRQHQAPEAQILRIAEKNPFVPLSLDFQHQQGRRQPIPAITGDKRTRPADQCARRSARSAPGRRTTRRRALTAHQ